MSANILNLSDFKVQRIDEADHDYHVRYPVAPGETRRTTQASRLQIAL